MQSSLFQNDRLLTIFIDNCCIDAAKKARKQFCL